MLKYIILLINSISILFFNIFFGDGVTITPKLPANVKPGTEFTAEIVVKKGSISGFSKLQVDLPQGFTAKELDSKGGAFSFVNGTVKYIWTALPAEEEFTVKFIVMTDAASEGTKQVLGKFSYIVNNAKQQADFGPVDIIMDGATAAVATNTVVPVTTTTTTPAGSDDNKVPESFSPAKDPNAAVSSNRRITNISPTEYEVAIAIKKENIKGFAKYTDKIPAGFKAVSIKTNGASFTFSDQVAKFVWVSLPSAEELQISYKLIMDTRPETNPLINGEFSYLENDQTQKILAPENIVYLPKEESTTPVVTNTVTPTTNTVEPVATNTVEPVATNTVAPVTTNTVEPVATNTVEPVVTNTVVPETVTTNTVAPVTSTAKASPGLNFHVQIGAFKNAITVDRIASIYGINDNIRTDMNEGLTKFLIGDYSDYKGARDKREGVKGKVSGAFVTAYNNGKRVTVQEALMISNQKWLR